MQPADERLIRLAEFLGVAWEALPLLRDQGEPAGYLERAVSAAALPESIGCDNASVSETPAGRIIGVAGAGLAAALSPPSNRNVDSA